MDFILADSRLETISDHYMSDLFWASHLYAFLSNDVDQW